MPLGSGRFFGENPPGRVVNGASWNQENWGGLVQENVLTIDVIFSKKERRSMNNDKQFLNFITANLKPILYSPTLPIKWYAVISSSCASWDLFTHNTKKILVWIQLLVSIFLSGNDSFYQKGLLVNIPHWRMLAYLCSHRGLRGERQGAAASPAWLAPWQCWVNKASSRNQSLFYMLSKCKQRPRFSYKGFETVRNYPGEIELFRKYADRTAQKLFP